VLVGVGVPVGVVVGLGVPVGVAVAVGVGLGVPVAVGVGLGVGVETVEKAISHIAAVGVDVGTACSKISGGFGVGVAFLTIFVVVDLGLFFSL